MNMNDTRSAAHQDGIGGVEQFEERSSIAHTAQQVAIAAVHQAERAVAGLVAIPATLALGGAAGVLLVAAVVEKGIDVVGESILEIGHRLNTTQRGTVLRGAEDRDRVARFMDQKAPRVHAPTGLVAERRPTAVVEFGVGGWRSVYRGVSTILDHMVIKLRTTAPSGAFATGGMSI